jgi:phospholipid-binding lipoprotein MlaA
MWGLRGIDNRSRLLYADAIVQNAYDPYAFIRNAYLQHRDFKVSGGQPSQDENQQEQQLLDEADQAEKDNAADAAAAPPPAAPTPPAGSPPPQ